jgi:hypothetical protein
MDRAAIILAAGAPEHFSGRVVFPLAADAGPEKCDKRIKGARHG